MNTLENNKLIAELMDLDVLYTDMVHHKSVPCNVVTKMKYDTSWDWLMPVVEKIESLGYYFDIKTKVVSVARDNKGSVDSFLVKAQFGNDSKLKKTYDCAVSAINYINCHILNK